MKGERRTNRELETPRARLDGGELARRGGGDEADGREARLGELDDVRGLDAVRAQFGDVGEGFDEVRVLFLALLLGHDDVLVLGLGRGVEGGELRGVLGDGRHGVVR